MTRAVSAYTTALEAAIRSNAVLVCAVFSLQCEFFAAVVGPIVEAVLPPSRARRSITSIVTSPYGGHVVISADFSSETMRG